MDDKPKDKQPENILGLFVRTASDEDTAAEQAQPDSDPLAPEPHDNGALPDLPECRPHFFRVREKLAPAWQWGLALLPLLVFLGWWLWATAGNPVELRRMSPTILPSPYEVGASFPSLWFDSALMRNILLSLMRVLAGFALATLLAVPLGILMASFSRIGSTFSLVATLLSYLPIPAIVPLTMAWWKTGEEQKVGFLALATFAYLLPLVVRHVSAVDHKYLLSAYAQGANSWQLVRRVLFPVAAPDIFNALRLCLGVGWTYIVLAEVIKAGDGVGGVGNLIMVFQRRGRMEEVYLTVLAIILVGAILDRICLLLNTWLFPYRATVGRE